MKNCPEPTKCNCHCDCPETKFEAPPPLPPPSENPPQRLIEPKAIAKPKKPENKPEEKNVFYSTISVLF